MYAGYLYLNAGKSRWESSLRNDNSNKLYIVWTLQNVVFFSGNTSVRIVEKSYGTTCAIVSFQARFLAALSCILIQVPNVTVVSKAPLSLRNACCALDKAARCLFLH